MKYYLLRLWEPDWVHMYPRHDGEMPESFSHEEALEKQEMFKTRFELETKIIPETEALNYEIPKRY